MELKALIHGYFHANSGDGGGPHSIFINNHTTHVALTHTANSGVFFISPEIIGDAVQGDDVKGICQER